MALELTLGETESLNEGVFTEGSAIVKLLAHYNQLPRVSSMEIASASAALDVRLDEVIADRSNDTFLMPLHVNAISKKYSAGDQNHYVGIVIKRLPDEVPDAEGAAPPEKHQVMYIDPMGAEPDPSIVAQIIAKLGVGARLRSSPSRLQYADLVDGVAEVASAEDKVDGTEASATAPQYFEGNDKDCGPILVYLMTRYAHNQGIPGVDSPEHSLAIGRRLRDIFRSDNGKEVAASVRLEEETLDTLVPPPRITPRELSGARASRNPDARYRRLDSIARIITGGDVCAAVAFDGRNILHANNNAEESDLSKEVFRFLVRVAQSETKLADMREYFGEEMEALLERSLDEYFTSMRSSRRSGARNKIDKEVVKYRSRFRRDFNKVVCALASDGDSDKKFAPEIVDALKAGAVEFVPGREGSSHMPDGSVRGRPVHAEMALLDRRRVLPCMILKFRKEKGHFILEYQNYVVEIVI